MMDDQVGRKHSSATRNSSSSSSSGDVGEKIAGFAIMCNGRRCARMCTFCVQVATAVVGSIFLSPT